MTVQPDLSSLRSYYVSYHAEKERMSYGAAVLYIGGATAVAFKAKDIWESGLPHAVIVVMLVFSAIVAFLFVHWQLKNRETAAGVVEACDVLLSSASTKTVTEPGTWRGVVLPGAVSQQLTLLSGTRDFLNGPKTAAAITLGTMVLWTIAALVALVIAHAA